MWEKNALPDQSKKTTTDRESLIPQSQLDSLNIADAKNFDAMQLLVNGKLMFVFWCVLGDDFHVTKGLIQEFPLSPDFASVGQHADVSTLAKKLDKAMHEALQYKKNAGMNIGNFNLAICRHITDQGDCLILEALGLPEIFDDIELYCSRVVRTSFE